MSTSFGKLLPLILLLVFGSAALGQSPAIDLEKSFMWTSGDGSEVGDEGVFSFKVTNTGDVTLQSVIVYDYEIGSVDLPDDLLGPGEMTIATATVPFVLTQQLLDIGMHTNFAQAYGDTTYGPTVTDMDYETVYFQQNPEIQVVKYVSVDGGMTYDDANAPPGPAVLAGDPVEWKYTIINTGNVALRSLSLIDSEIGPIALSVGSLARGESTDAFENGVATEGQYMNSADVYALTWSSTSASDSDVAYYLGIGGELTLVKSVGLSPTGPWIDANSAVILPPGVDLYFRYFVVNTGNTTLTDITITDSVFDAGSTPPFNPPMVVSLPPGDDFTYVYGPVTIAEGGHSDIGTVTGSTPLDNLVSDTDPVHILISRSFTLLQAYPCDPEASVPFAGYLSSTGSTIGAVPGILKIVPQGPGEPPWANYVRAFLDDYPYTIKNVTLVKTTPEVVQCADVFPANVISQQGTPNIRLWWPLMYENPGTTWKLTIVYGTSSPYDADGPGPSPEGYVHTEEWEWKVVATIASMRDLLELFHELPFGRDEVPLISDEVLYLALQAKLDVLETAVEQDPVAAGLLLADFEMEVMDACIAESPSRPWPTGNGTGIAQTTENPACCKLLADAEYIGFDLGIFQPRK